MPSLAWPQLGPAASSGASDANWRLWSVGSHSNISGFTQIPFCSTSSPLQSPHSTWLEERRRVQLLVVASFPWALAVSREGGKGGGIVAAVALIRGWASRPMSCTVHQRRSANQPESQMTPKTCTVLLDNPPPLLWPLVLLSSTTPIITYLPFLLTLTCSSHSLTNLHHPYHPTPSFIYLSVSAPST